MKIVFVGMAAEALSVEYLSAAARARGHDTALVLDPCLFDDAMVRMPALARVFSQRRRVAARVAAEQPDLIAFSLLSNCLDWFRDTARAVRALTPAPIIAGNIHVTSAPGSTLENECVDCIVRGEGEGAFLDVLDSLSSGGIDPDIPNLGLRHNGAARINPLRPLIGDLDTLPFPDKDLYRGTPFTSRDFYTIITERGCPFHCTYCANSLLHTLYGAKGFVRHRSAENVIEELSAALEKYDPQYILFYDEIFGHSRRRLEALAGLYARHIKRPYFVTSHPSVVDEDYARILAETGCGKVALGVQTMSAEKRRAVFGRTETNEHVRRAVELLRRNNIYVSVDTILDFPGETEADLAETAAFFNVVRPDLLQTYWLAYYPGTAIVEIAAAHGALPPDEATRIHAGHAQGMLSTGRNPAPLQRKFYLLLTITPLLPRRWIDAMLRRRLWRFIPARFPAMAIFLFQGLFLRKSPFAKLPVRQQMRRYAFYMKKNIRG